MIKILACIVFILVSIFAVAEVTLLYTDYNYGLELHKSALPIPNAEWVSLYGDSLDSRQTHVLAYFIEEERKEKQNAQAPSPNP